MTVTTRWCAELRHGQVEKRDGILDRITFEQATPYLAKRSKEAYFRPPVS
jgi:hypothetical protein